MSELETLLILAKIMTWILAAAFVGCLVSDYIIEPLLNWFESKKQGETK